MQVCNNYGITTDTAQIASHWQSSSGNTDRSLVAAAGGPPEICLLVLWQFVARPSVAATHQPAGGPPEALWWWQGGMTPKYLPPGCPWRFIIGMEMADQQRQAAGEPIAKSGWHAAWSDAASMWPEDQQWHLRGKPLPLNHPKPKACVLGNRQEYISGCSIIHNL